MSGIPNRSLHENTTHSIPKRRPLTRGGVKELRILLLVGLSALRHLTSLVICLLSFGGLCFAQEVDAPNARGNVSVVAPPGATAPSTTTAPKRAPRYFLNDTSISFTYFSSATDPGVSGSAGSVPGGIPGKSNTFSRYSFSLDHFDVWKYGTNQIHGEFNQYGSNDPVNGIPGAVGTREFLGLWTGTLGFNELSHSKAFSSVLTKDASLMLNFSAESENNFHAPEMEAIAPGLQFTLKLPGVVNIGIAGMKEWNHNTYSACGPAEPFSGVAYVGFQGQCIGGGTSSGNTSMDWTWKINSFVSEPLTFLPSNLPLTFQNQLNVTGPKGTGLSAGQCVALGCAGGLGPHDAFGINNTKTEVFEDGRLSIDASKVRGGTPGTWDIYLGYRYWYNKYGQNHKDWLFATVAPGSAMERSPYVGMTYHF